MLENIDLSYMILCGRDFSHVYLKNVNFENSDLTGCDFKNATILCCNMRNSNLMFSQLINTNLSAVDFKYCKLHAADLDNASIRNPKNIEKVFYDEHTRFFAMQCPEEGSFIGYKKAEGLIIKLLITEDAKRSSATSRKCRCSKAKILSITSKDGTKEYDEATSDHDSDFIYRTGKTIEVKNFNEDRWNECTRGIHFFLTRREAELYC